jgi:hypothetical protein
MSNIENVIRNCAGNLPIDCELDIDRSCLLKVTLDCFGQIIANTAASAAVQLGGGERPFSEDFNSLVPYLTAYNIKNVDDKTLIPAGLIQSEHSRSKHFEDLIKLRTVLTPKGINALNEELQQYAVRTVGDGYRGIDDLGPDKTV